LDCIGEFTGEEMPLFAFSNKRILENYLNYQDENLQLQKEMIDEQIVDIKGKPQNMAPKKTLEFFIPEELFEKQEVLESKQSWERLLKDIGLNRLSTKEITVLRIYFTFMNYKNIGVSECDNASFTKMLAQTVKKNVGINIDRLSKPEVQFKFTEDIKYRSMELMMQVDLNELIQAKYCPLVEAMLFVIVEAIQHLDAIGQEQSTSQRAEENDETEINTLEYVRDSFEEKL
jgi:large-conductance mechanosensitive channel